MKTRKTGGGTAPAALLLLFLPLVLFLGNVLVMRLSGQKVTLIPTISDEMFWYHQIAGTVDAGLPLGYYGYNGAHAAIGNFGPWGPAVLLPYVLWGRLFGFELYSMFYANIAFLGLGLTAFALLAQVQKTQLPYVLLAYCTLLLNIHYCAAAMAEPLHYALGMVLTGCMVRLWKGKCSRIFTWAVVPILLIYSTQAYLLLALFVPVYLLIVLPVRSRVLRCILTGGITLPYAFVQRAIFRKLQATYSHKGTGETGLQELLQKKVQDALTVLRNFHPRHLLENRTTAGGLLSLILLTYLIVGALCLVLLVHYWVKAGRVSTEALAAAFLLAGALAAYCLLYPNPSLWTLCRGLNTALCCAVLLLALLKNRFATALLLLCAAVSLPSFYTVTKNNQNRRTFSETQMQLYAEASEEFAELMDISSEHTLWENTIAQYGSRGDGDQTILTLALPRAAGYNVMLDRSVISDAGYAVMYHSFKDVQVQEELLERLKEAGYRVIYTHEAMDLLAR